MKGKIRRAKFIRFPRIMGMDCHPHEAVWPLAAAISATALRQTGVQTELIDLAIKNNFSASELQEKIIQEETDVLFMQLETPSLNAALRFAKEIKGLQGSLKIIAYGQHAFALAREILRDENIDMCICTDPESVIKEVVRALEEGHMRSVNDIAFRDENGEIIFTARKEAPVDIDTFPYIDLSLISLAGYRKKKFPKPFYWGAHWGFIRTSLGCPNACIFCSPLLRHSVSKAYRRHSLAYVTGQIRYYKERFGINVFSMEDDSFCVDEASTVSLCEAIVPLKIKWVTDGVRADSLSPAVLSAMKRAGCFGVGIGIESGSQRILNVLGKGQSVESIRESASQVKKAGMMLAGYVMIGSPTETEADLEATVRLVRDIKPHVLYLHYFIPYPGSAVYEKYKNEIEVNGFNHYTLEGHNFSNIETQKLKAFMKYFYSAYYFSAGYAREYLKGRFRYIIFDTHEFGLIKEAFRFITHGRKGTGK